MITTLLKVHRQPMVCLLSLSLMLAFVGPAPADDSAFVGILALTGDEAVAKKLGLDEDTQAKLKELIDQRVAAAEKLVLDNKDLPEAERNQKLAEFVAESEKLGLELLTPDQRTKLDQARIHKAGLITLTEPRIATELGLSEEQNAKILVLAGQLKAELTRGGENERQATLAKYERQLADTLTAPQRIAWNMLAGQDGGQVASDPPKDEPTEPGSDDKPEVKPNGEPAVRPDPKVAVQPDKDARLRFNFQYSPWEHVLEWFAEQTGYSLQMDQPPVGTFNFSDSSSYTPSQALDRINSVLLTRGYTLLRNGNLLILINVVEDGIPPALIENITPEELVERGKYEIVKCLFGIEHMLIEDAETEIRPLVTGDTTFVHIMPGSRQILVQDTVGNLRMVARILEKSEMEAKGKAVELRTHKLEFVTSEEVMLVARPLLGIQDEAWTTADGSLSISTDVVRLFYAGLPVMIERFEGIVKQVDIDPELDPNATLPETPQLEVYNTSKVDPDTTLDVVKVILADMEQVRATVDPKTGNLIVHAKPSQHATVRALLEQMAKDASAFEVIHLRRSDPATIITMLDIFFEKGLGAEGEAPKGPIYTGDLVSNQLLVRGTGAEIEQIKDIVNKVDPELDDFALGQRETVRLIPFGGGASSLLGEADILWRNSGRPNIIRKMPSESFNSTIPSRGDFGPRRDRGFVDPDEPPSDNDAETQPNAKETGFKTTMRSPSRVQVRFTGQSRPTSRDRITRVPARKPVAQTLFVSQVEDDSQPKADTPNNGDRGDIRVTVTDSGIFIESDDLDALDDYEQILRDLINQRGTVAMPPTIFYLKYAGASDAAATLESYLGISSGGAGGGGGLGGMLGGMAGNVLGGAAGDLLGGLLGGGGSDTTYSDITSGTVKIVAEPRLNALIVQANAMDLDLIESLLNEIDQSYAPQDPMTDGPTEVIPVYYTTATAMADVVKQAFPNQIVGAGGSSQQQRQPSPQEFLQALAGGRGGRSGRSGNSQQPAEPPKMSVAVDQGSNSLVVTGPEHLIARAKDLVERLDKRELIQNEGISVISLNGNVNSELLKNALTSILGDNVTASTTTGSSSTPTSSNSSGNNSGGDDGRAAALEAIRARMIQQGLQNAGGQPGGAGGTFGGGQPGGAFGGRPGGGGNFGGGRTGDGPTGAFGGGRTGGRGR